MDSKTAKTAIEIIQVIGLLEKLSKKKDIVEPAISFLEKAGIIIDANSEKSFTGIRFFGDKYALV